ncbi:MAG: hypothetical protein ASARMPREDX12_005274 [Alectoria sarmentosa]|nr:MAG: hypothetical protein ASARMPRED_007772 [Alectoria sarmentosa]CAD6591602.1 MAG: hypothetical protein ASARMPREDX12_005274 [Alectoria sarmentosa]
MPRNKQISTPFPVLRLPPEIRNHIWRYVVVKDREVTFRRRIRQPLLLEKWLRSGKPRRSQQKLQQEVEERWLSSQLAVAFTCRQLYLEVAPIYYGENTFQPHPGDEWDILKYRRIIEHFTDAIGSRNASTIPELHLSHGWDLVHIHNLSLLPGLKRLYLEKNGDRPRQKQSMTWLAQKHASLIVICDGEAWHPEEWILYPEDKW